MDTVDATTRSRMMSRIRSTRNRTTECRLRACLVVSGISGWTLTPTDIAGTPDIVFRALRIAIFIDGCFWHYCPLCGHIPKSSRRYWSTKLQRNRLRDQQVTRSLRRQGWAVLRFWEHEVADCTEHVVDKIMAKIRNRTRMFHTPSN